MKNFFNDDIESDYDIVVIGAGPAGLASAIYTKRDGYSTLVLERSTPGGAVGLTHIVENYPGVGTIAGSDLALSMLKQADEIGAKVRYGECTSIKKDGKYFIINLSSGKSVKTKAIILAMGSIPKMTGVDGEEKFRGHGVSTCATCDGAFFKGKDVAVIGGGNAAIEEGEYLTRHANKVYIVHRRDTFRASQHAIDNARANNKIEFVTDAKLHKIEGEQNIRNIVVDVHGSFRTIPVSGVFIYIGSYAATEMVRGMVKLDDNGYIITDDNMMASAEGLFAAGDVRAKSIRQITTATGDGTIASQFAGKYISANF